MLPKPQYIKLDRESDEELEVYEGEIIDEDVEKKAVEKQPVKSPSLNLAYKLGAFTGSLLSLLGLINEASSLFKHSPKNSPGKNRRGSGLRRRRNRKK